MKVELFWVVIIAGFSVCAGGVIDDLLEADCPEPVLDTLSVAVIPIYRKDSIAALEKQLNRANDAEVWVDRATRCEQSKRLVWDSITVDSGLHSSVMYMPRLRSSGGVYRYQVNIFPESTFAYQWERCNQIIDSPERRLSGMVSITAVDSFVWHRDTAYESGIHWWRTWQKFKRDRGL